MNMKCSEHHFLHTILCWRVRENIRKKLCTYAGKSRQGYMWNDGLCFVSCKTLGAPRTRSFLTVSHKPWEQNELFCRKAALNRDITFGISVSDHGCGLRWNKSGFPYFKEALGLRTFTFKMKLLFSVRETVRAVLILGKINQNCNRFAGKCFKGLVATLSCRCKYRTHEKSQLLSL